MTKFHLGFPSPSIANLKMAENAPLARRCEELGFDVLWHSNERFYREMFIRMASSAMATSHIQLGGAVAEPFAVHPILTAQSLATVDELSDGRANLALGAGGSGFQMMEVKRHHSATALREAYGIMKRLLAGEEVTFQGQIITAEHARLQFTSNHSIPLWIATRGDRTLETSGAYADAIMLATYANPAGIHQAMGLIEQGARGAGRSIETLRLMSRVETCVHRDPHLAYEGTRLMLARILWVSYPDRGFVKRAGLEVPAELEALIAKRDYDLVPQAVNLIPDEFVEGFTWAGTPAMVAERVITVARETGIREFGFWVLLVAGQSREEAAHLIAAEVLPLVRTAID